jgi:lipase (class 3)
MKTPIIRCTSEPSFDRCKAELQVAHPAGNRYRLTRRAASGQAVKTAWLLLLANLVVGEFTCSGCASSPDEYPPESSAIAPIDSNDFGLPAQSETYYMVMASAAASAYPARFERTTMEVTDERGFPERVLRADHNLRLLTSATDETQFTTYVDTTSPTVTRVIIAFRGTVKPQLTAPLSSWRDVLTDVRSQFFTTIHINPLLAAESFGTVGEGWLLRWYDSLQAKHNALKETITRDIIAYTRISHVEVNVVGHSLGGVVAELAGLDIESYLNRNATNYEVNVIAFNPPRLGSRGLVGEYRRRLKERPKQLRISVFTREGDIVDDLPFNLPLWFIGGSFHQVINNVAFDNLTPFCSRYMFGGADDPNKAGPDGEARRLPYAPRFHVTQPFGYAPHSIDDWVGSPQGNIEHRQVLDHINPPGFRCLFAPHTLGTLTQRTGPPYEPQLNCTEYSTGLWTSECNPHPPRGDRPRDEL